MHTLLAYPPGKEGDSFSVPSAVKHIASSAFAFSSLSCIELPADLLSIGDCCFLCCEQLCSISIPNSITDIGVRAFDGCEHLPSELLPADYIDQLVEEVSSLGEFPF